MPITPGPIERLLLLRLNRGPAVMLDFLGAQAFRVVCIATKLGVLEALRDGPLASAAVARRIEADERGTTLLLEALEALGYVASRNGRYANTPATVKWLLRDSPKSLAAGIPFFEDMVFDRWAHLGESIRRGKPVIYGYDWLNERPGRWRDYEEGMLATARMAADEVVTKVKLSSGAQRLLDVGGGHGLYSIAFCRRHPRLSATVFDLPQALEVARQTIAANGMSERVSVREGDFSKDDLGAGYDVVLAFNIIHAHSPEQNTDLLRKISDSLNETGRIAILDQMAGKGLGPAAKALVRLEALNFFNDLGARTYSFEEIGSWLQEAGFVGLRQVNLRTAPGFGLVLGTKAR